MIRNNNVLLIIGMLSLVAAILLHQFGPEVSTAHFLQGMFVGISITLNLSFLIRLRLARKR